MNSALVTLSQILDEAATAPQRQWLQRGWPNAPASAQLNSVRAMFAGMGRRLGSAPLAAPLNARLASQVRLGAALWDLATLGRVALLLQALELQPPHAQVDFARQIYLQGDAAEQSAVLRALASMPDPARFVDLAVEACRTNVADILAALACENPFPAQYLPEHAFNQMVMKAIFIGLDTQRIEGLSARAGADLKRMVTDFASERRAAARAVPPDIARILAMPGATVSM